MQQTRCRLQLYLCGFAKFINCSIISYKLKYKIEGNVHRFDEFFFGIGQGRGAVKSSIFYSPHPFAFALHLYAEIRPPVVGIG